MNTSIWTQHYDFKLGSLFSVVHNGLALLGLVTVAAVILYAGRLTNEVSDNRTASIGQIRYAGNVLIDASPEADGQQNRALATYLSRRYKIAVDATEELVVAAFEASKKVGIDPLLLLAVMAVESRFNPIAESEFGAKGLMQVIPKFHQDKVEELGGANAVLHPMTNIMIGAQILKQYIRQTGSVESGLQVYNGALADTTNQYAQKVISEQERMRQAIRATRPTAKNSAPAA